MSSSYTFFTQPQPNPEGNRQRVHLLKTWPSPFDAVWGGVKTAEYRDNLDRDFRAGDLLLLREYRPESAFYTGRTMVADVSHVQGEGFGIPANFAVLSIRVFGWYNARTVNNVPSQVAEWLSRAS